MRLPSVLVAATVLLAGGLTGAAPAAANGAAPNTSAPVPVVSGRSVGVTTFTGSNCPQDSLCLYRDHGFTGGGLALRVGDSVESLGQYGFNDRMSSWSNDSGVDCLWTPDSYGQGTAHPMIAGQRINVTPQENDTASAVYCA